MAGDVLGADVLDDATAQVVDEAGGIENPGGPSVLGGGSEVVKLGWYGAASMVPGWRPGGVWQGCSQGDRWIPWCPP